MRKIIKPIRECLQYDEIEATPEAIAQALLNRFAVKVGRGEVSIDSTADFSRIVEVLADWKGVSEAKDTQLLPNLTVESEKALEEFYKTLSSEINEDHDEANKGGERSEL